jgi:hypothetical protein
MSMFSDLGEVSVAHAPQPTDTSETSGSEPVQNPGERDLRLGFAEEGA